MREIKFRAKIEGTDAWIIGLPYAVYSDNEIDSIQSVEAKQVEYIKTDTLGQFTGFKDKNGMMIFDGDILTDTEETEDGVIHSRNQVYWDQNDGMWMLDCSSKLDRTHGYNLAQELRDFEFSVLENEEKL